MKYNDLYQVTALLEQPLQTREDYHLILLVNPSDCKLTAGDHSAILQENTLLLTAPLLPLSLDTSRHKNEKLNGVLIKIPADLFGDKFLGKNQLAQVNGLLEKARQGIRFSTETARSFESRIRDLEESSGFHAFLDLISLLHDLSISPGWNILSEQIFTRQTVPPEQHRIESAFAYMKANYSKPISLADVAGKAHMSRGAFCRFIRKRTGKTYVESMNEIRIGHICRMLVETTENVSEIAYKAGYNNIHYFHRWFKRQEGCTPKEFRERRLKEAS